VSDICPPTHGQARARALFSVSPPHLEIDRGTDHIPVDLDLRPLCPLRSSSCTRRRATGSTSMAADALPVGALVGKSTQKERACERSHGRARCARIHYPCRRNSSWQCCRIKRRCKQGPETSRAAALGRSTTTCLPASQRAPATESRQHAQEMNSADATDAGPGCTSSG
jgi:hypothetical protein